MSPYRLVKSMCRPVGYDNEHTYLRYLGLGRGKLAELRARGVLSVWLVRLKDSHGGGEWPRTISSGMRSAGGSSRGSPLFSCAGSSGQGSFRI